MAAGSPRRRRRWWCAVAVLLSALVLVWISDEVTTVKLLGTTRKYVKDGSTVNQQVKQLLARYTTNNETMAEQGKNNASATSNVSSLNTTNQTLPTKAAVSTSSESIHVQTATRNATIVVQLRGEMGNNLMALAEGLVVKLLAKQEYGISAKLVIRHQNHAKWVRARDSIRKCFPKLRDYDFAAANTAEFDALALEQDRALEQAKWDPEKLKIKAGHDGIGPVDDSLSYWKSILESPSLVHINVSDAVPVSFPFLSVDTFCNNDMVDKYLSEIRDFFEFDKSACCKLQPDPVESVFHLRNFLVEMPRRGKGLGFEELSPNKTANELFGHLHSSDKVAITTRFGGDKVAPYVSALEERGLQVRVIEGQSGTEDFCFLMTAQKELVGTAVSTFTRWAAFLGDMKRAMLYSVDSPRTRERGKSYRPLNWTNPDLMDRVFSESFKSEEQDALEAKEQQRRMLLFQEWSEI